MAEQGNSLFSQDKFDFLKVSQDEPLASKLVVRDSGKLETPLLSYFNLQSLSLPGEMGTLSDFLGTFKTTH